jgi:predicted metalloendopeptidase
MTKFDNSLRPQDDFFGYINNNWLKSNPIPDDESVWGTFHELRDKSASAIKEIVDELTQKLDNDLTHDQKLIKTFFSASLGFDSHKDGHIKSLKNELSKIDKIKNRDELAHYLGTAHRAGFNSFWSNYVSLDDKNSQVQALIFFQGGLTLPNRDYYLDETAKMKKLRKDYEAFRISVQKLLSEHISFNNKNIINIELLIARSSLPEDKLRDVHKNYNHFTLNELQSKLSSFNWSEYFQGCNWKTPNDNIVIEQLSFIEKVLQIINEADLDSIKDYLKWQVINDLIEWISHDSAKLSFEFHEQLINGKPNDKPVWKRAVLLSNDLIIGEALGREYAARHFPESSKQEVVDIVKDIRDSYHKRIDKVTWMKDRTKQTAHKKLDNIKVLIGYPSIWKDLTKLQLQNDNHIANILALRSFESDTQMIKIGDKPPTEDWLMNAHTVNAYFHPSQLVICFPAGILQPPFYNPNASYASNLGGIGSVIGHEFTHGFDDQGAEHDEFGNIKKWVTEVERKTFKKMSKKIIKQSNEYEVLPGLFLNGKLILGEAIADIGGLQLAVEALQNNSKNNSNQSLRDLFIGFAIAERGSQRDEHLVKQVKTDPHPPSKFRVNCTVAHIDEFYEAFDVTVNDKIYIAPDFRSYIW